MANAATDPAERPRLPYAPSVKAEPAPEAKPGWHNHHGIWHINALNGN